MNIKRMRLVGSRCAVILAQAVGFSVIVGAEIHKDTVTSESDRSDVDFAATVEDGVLFLNWNYVAPPFQICADENGITVNGQTYIPMTDVDRTTQNDRRSRGRGNTEYNTETPESRRGNRRMGSRGMPRRSGRSAEAFPTIRQARALVTSIDNSSVVWATDNAPLRNLALATEEYHFYQTLLAENPAPEQVDRFVRLIGTEKTHDQIHQWVSEFVPADNLRTLMESTVQEISQIETANRTHQAAVIRMQRFAYPLTVLGMLLGVYALGHMLKWTGKGLAEEPDTASSPESTRFVVVALLLMLAMSTVDLIWTILAGQAGIMKEINPLAAGFLDSPVKLAMFKVIATSAGLGILFVWRHRLQIQQATWWMCLVCVLLTFRWVVFDSLSS